MNSKEIIIGNKIEKAFILFESKRKLLNLLIDISLIANLDVTRQKDMPLFEKQLHDCYTAYIKNNKDNTYRT